MTMMHIELRHASLLVNWWRRRLSSRGSGILAAAAGRAEPHARLRQPPPGGNRCGAARKTLRQGDALLVAETRRLLGAPQRRNPPLCAEPAVQLRHTAQNLLVPCFSTIVGETLLTAPAALGNGVLRGRHAVSHPAAAAGAAVGRAARQIRRRGRRRDLHGGGPRSAAGQG